MGWGRDGKFYPNTREGINEQKAADSRWNQQEKQNELLQEQNRIKKKEVEIREKEQKEKNKILQEQNYLIQKQNEEQKYKKEELEKQTKELERQTQELQRNSEELQRNNEEIANILNEIADDLKSNNNSNNEMKIQQFDMSKENAETYADRGMMYLEDENTEKASEFFEMALDINPKLALAHLGKFLVSHGVSSLNDLRNRILADLENSKDFMRALQFSEGENKAILEEFFENNKMQRENLKQDFRELCKNWEQKQINMKKENEKVAQQLFDETNKEMQKLKNDELQIEKEIYEFEEKLKSLGFFRGKEKESIKNQIENKKINISQIQKTKENLIKRYKSEIKKLYEKELKELKEFKNLMEHTDNEFFTEQISRALKNFDIDIEMCSKLDEVKSIEELLSNDEITISLVQKKLEVGYAAARKNIRATSRKRCNFRL